MDPLTTDTDINPYQTQLCSDTINQIKANTKLKKKIRSHHIKTKQTPKINQINMYSRIIIHSQLILDYPPLLTRSAELTSKLKHEQLRNQKTICINKRTEKSK